VLDLSKYAELHGVRVNLVQGLGGVTSDANGSSRGISNSDDRDLLLHLRSLADVLLTDGETARLERYKIPKNSDLAVFTRKGYVPETGTSEHRLIEIADESLANAIDVLKTLGYQRILIEAGPNLLRDSWHAFDELCLSNTSGSTADLDTLGIAQAKLVATQSKNDATFTVWREIQGF
jgi:riboflavin biosynthesis pyrimidine reductase